MNLAATMSLENRGFLNPLAAAQGALSGFKSLAAGVLGPLAAMAGAAGVAGLAFKAINEAADMETLRVAFEVLLGSADAAKNRLKELADFAAATPFELPELASATKKLLAFGIADRDVMETLRRLGDTASAIGAPIGDIAEIYGKARVQGRLFAEDINQLTGRGIPIIQELATQFKVAESDVRGLVESGKVGFPQIEKAFANLTGEASKFGGMMAKQSQTWNGLMSSLKDNVNALFREFGTPIIDQLKPILSSAVETAGALATQARGLGESVANAVGFLVDAFAQGQLGDVLGMSLKAGLLVAGDALIQRLADGVEEIKPAFLQLMEAVGEKFKAIGNLLAASIKLALMEALPDMFEETKKRLGFSAGMNIGEAQVHSKNADAIFAQTVPGLSKFLTQDATSAADELRGKFGAFLTRRGIDSDVAGEGDLIAKMFGGGGGAAASAAALAGKPRASEGDRLAKIGLFVGGGGGPAMEHARKTATNTDRLVTLTRSLIDKVGAINIPATGWA